MEQLKALKFRNIGPAGMSGRVTAIDVIQSQPNSIYIGTASGGVWRSTSGGIQWEPIFDKQPTQSIGALAINQRNPAEIWVGTGEGNPRNSQNSGEGIFKSIDGGKTWKCMGLQGTKAIHRVVINKDNSDIVYVAALGSAWGANDERGLFKTTDGGKTWRKILYINDLTGCADLVCDPSNPNKLVASMWEYNRKPYFFNSGGKGSGLYVSFDGGENWERKGEKEGLPKGDLGRIGLAIAPSKPNIIYAIVEAKDNAFYRSTDGGCKWSKMTDKGFGDRPFYYSEIYCDPKNENRVYSIFTTISRSEDGGSNWNSFAGWVIHPDHHAFWISPDNPDYIINGNDGGLNITRDGGNSWQFVENLPLGQFYHVNIDDEIPYNVYGGLQDNGSWVGPSSVWRNGGIRNFDWKELYFGDGFDVLPRRDNHRYIYAMSQGGNLGLVDKETGSTESIKPIHPDGKPLRFHWNSALAQNPFADKGIYYGSQYVHKSMDAGHSWQLISPDLTTNDTIKTRNDKTGGLTPDVTSAETHCTILAIAPSLKDENTIWVGTDDGNLQLTLDGGETWTNVIKNIKNAPKNGWIPQIEVSRRNAAEAFVVLNNYRQNDWKPYLFYTNDMGKTWKNLVENKVKGHVLSVIQDPTEPNLLFCGTDGGLWVSIDMGETWTKWRDDFPSVNVMDMKISERDADLVVATFGRAIWILDDIRPLRELAKTKGEALKQPFKLFAAPDAYLAEFRSYEGIRFDANSYFKGANKPTHSVVTIWVKELLEKKESEKEGKKESAGGSKNGVKKDDKEKEKKIKVRIINEKGDTIRTLSSDIDTFLCKIAWRLDQKGERYPSREEAKPDANEPSGDAVLPGKYKIIATYLDYKDSTSVTVHADPRLAVSRAAMEAKNTALSNFNKIIKATTSANNRLREMEKTIQLVENQWINVPDSTKKEVLKLASAIKDSIGNYQTQILGKKDQKGINRDDQTLLSKLYTTSSYLSSSEGNPSANMLLSYEQTKIEVEKIVAKVNLLLEKDYTAWQTKAETVQYSLFKKVEKVKIE